ncbi:VapE domain-containing protein [Nioella aestuarii]|uniref:VapE domain-containing protein n=1 Tax=Nioella aestuarii TaxID=1662864 RepID=UPI003D7FC341
MRGNTKPRCLIENLRGWWVKEMAEMKVARRADSNTLKRTLSATHDQFRLAYSPLTSSLL